MANSGSSRSSWRNSVSSIFGGKSKADSFDSKTTTSRNRFSVSRWSTSSTATTTSTVSSHRTADSSRGDWDVLLSKSSQQPAKNLHSDPSEPNKQRYGPGHGPTQAQSDADDIFFY